ncbi:SprT-like domain-containing protein [Catenovulum sp. 2E275]|uniref:SprT family zinc-dependent metalloprotease n=1 Tax=Catenovulum sp. 2E275 TaxID=2980497 RepID=UPI0021CE02EB|nr:SprT family zinc-dependent metalloprotease [Catenovulum sp. 2E275]MCU4674261.1 SprT-like domain-containing protein [Catenovulum sp. 2E275]
MMDLIDKQQQIRQLFAEIKQSYQSHFPQLADYQLKFTNTKSVLGSCNYKKRQIAISLPVLAQNPLDVQIDTLKHEFAHALAFMQGERGHGKIWKAWALKLGATPRSRAQKPVKTSYKYQLVLKKDKNIQLLERKYHRKVKLKNKYMRGDAASLNKLFLVQITELEAYLAGKLTLEQLNLLQ